MAIKTERKSPAFWASWRKKKYEALGIAEHRNPEYQSPNKRYGVISVVFGIHGFRSVLANKIIKDGDIVEIMHPEEKWIPVTVTLDIHKYEVQDMAATIRLSDERSYFRVLWEDYLPARVMLDGIEARWPEGK